MRPLGIIYSSVKKYLLQDRKIYKSEGITIPEE